MRFSFKGRRLMAFLFAPSNREQHLVRYVMREHRLGRRLSDVLDDAYVRNWSTPEERARLLERPEVVAEIGENLVAELRLALVAARP